MGFLDVLIIMILIIALIGAFQFLKMRWFGYAAIFGLLFVVGFFVMMQSPLGDQIRTQMSEQKASAGKVQGKG